MSERKTCREWFDYRYRQADMLVIYWIGLVFGLIIGFCIGYFP